MASDHRPEPRALLEPDVDDPLVTFAEAAALTGYAERTLRNMRYNRDPDPPPFVEVRPRSWRARRSEVLRWAALRAQTVNGPAAGRRTCGEAS